MCLAHTPRAKATFILSQVALLLFSLLQIPMRRYPHFHPDLMDGVRGLCLGIAIAAIFLTFRRNREARV